MQMVSWGLWVQNEGSNGTYYLVSMKQECLSKIDTPQLGYFGMEQRS